MVKSNVRKQREYRERKKLKDEEYLETESRRQKKYLYHWEN